MLPSHILYLLQLDEVKEQEGSVKVEGREGGGLERSRSSSDLRSSRSNLRPPLVRANQQPEAAQTAAAAAAARQPELLHSSLACGNSSALLRIKSKSSWELSNSWGSDSSSKGSSSCWEGNSSSGESSKRSSPEPESEFLRVFAQLRAARTVAV